MSAATCSRALDGMHPRYRHTPPGFCSRSISVTFIPRSAARNAAAYPPGPPPITAMFKLELSFIENELTTKATRVHEGKLLNCFLRVPSAFFVHAFLTYPCTESKNGCSNASAIQRRKRAASAPSINLWSYDSDSGSTSRGSNLLLIHTGS